MRTPYNAYASGLYICRSNGYGHPDLPVATGKSEFKLLHSLSHIERKVVAQGLPTEDIFYEKRFDMILCFGTFATILNLCRQDLTQLRFLVSLVWALDRKNSALGSDLEDIVDDPDGMEGNKPVVSRLLSCERPLKLRDEQLPSLSVARERFKAKVLPHINEDKIAGAVLSVLYIIQFDDTIDEEHRETFKKHLGVNKEELLRQTTFNVPDFFTRILLYTTCVDNKKGKPYVKDITDKFIEDAKAATLAKIEWDSETQTIVIAIPSLSEEKNEFSEKVRCLSELRLSLTVSQMDFKLEDTSWLGEMESFLFPTRYPIKFKDAKTKKVVADKVAQCMAATKEYILCLQSAMAKGETGQQSLFLDKAMQNARQQFTALYEELFFLGLFPDRFNPE